MRHIGILVEPSNRPLVGRLGCWLWVCAAAARAWYVVRPIHGPWLDFGPYYAGCSPVLVVSAPDVDPDWCAGPLARHLHLRVLSGSFDLVYVEALSMQPLAAEHF